MSAKLLRNLADRIGTAGPEAETALFEDALRVFADGTTPGERARWQRYLRHRAFLELATALYRARFVDGGFQFGMLAGAGSKSIANVWRAGDSRAAIQQAATPALALLRATAVEAANALDARTAAHCPVCAGRGWFVTAAARKHVCRHQRAAPVTSGQAANRPA